MITIIKRGSTKEEIKAKLEERSQEPKKNKIDWARFCGSISLKEDPLELQK